MNDLFPLLKLTFRAFHEFGISAHGIVVSRFHVRAPELRDLAGGFVDGHYVASHDFLLGHGIDHLAAHVVHCLHVRCLDRKLALFCALLND